MTGEAKSRRMTIVGECNCPSCKRVIPFKEQSNGRASVSCGWCGFQAYARGDESDEKMRTWITTRNAPEPAPEPADQGKRVKKKQENAPEPEKSFFTL